MGWGSGWRARRGWLTEFVDWASRRVGIVSETGILKASSSYFRDGGLINVVIYLAQLVAGQKAVVMCCR